MTREFWEYVRQDGLHISAFIALNALLSNFLPDAALLRRWPRLRYVYEVLVDVVAGFALNWRTRLPSLDAQFLGFKRITRHAYRNWLQKKVDKGYL